MRTGVIIAAAICTGLAALIGFGVIDDAGWQEDLFGWGFSGLTLWTLSTFVPDR